MLSKCANPECGEVFRYLHQGKIFHLPPTLEPQATTAPGSSPPLRERFWLCAQCSKRMTLIWDGTRVKLVYLPIPTRQIEPLSAPPVPGNEIMNKRRSRRRAASAGRDDE